MVDSTTKNLEPLDLNQYNFFELMAHEADDKKDILVFQLVKLAGQGDPAALRLLETAVKLATPTDDKNKPIPILGGITQTKSSDVVTQTQNVVPSDNRPPQNPKAK